MKKYKIKYFLHPQFLERILNSVSLVVLSSIFNFWVWICHFPSYFSVTFSVKFLFLLIMIHSPWLGKSRDLLMPIKRKWSALHNFKVLESLFGKYHNIFTVDGFYLFAFCRSAHTLNGFEWNVSIPVNNEPIELRPPSHTIDCILTGIPCNDSRPTQSGLQRTHIHTHNQALQHITSTIGNVICPSSFLLSIPHNPQLINDILKIHPIKWRLGMNIETEWHKGQAVAPSTITT